MARRARSAAHRDRQPAAIAANFAFAMQRRVRLQTRGRLPALGSSTPFTSPIFNGIAVVNSRAAAVRHAGLVNARQTGAGRPRTLSGRLPFRRPLSCRTSATDAAFLLPRPPADGMPGRTFARPVEVQIPDRC